MRNRFHIISVFMVLILHFTVNNVYSGNELHTVDCSENESGPGDEVLISSRGKAEVKGEVRYPGTYILEKGETLSSLLEKAGGYTDRAYLRGAIFTRESVRKLQQKRLDEMVGRLEKELAGHAGSEAQRKFIASLRELRASGRLSINLVHLRLLKGSEYDIALEHGDTLFIPAKGGVVSVIGSVVSQGDFIYSERLDSADYIEMAGGIKDCADEDNIYVLKVDGTSMKLDQSGIRWNSSESRWEIDAFGEPSKKIEPGDSIVVPQKFDSIGWLGEVEDITRVLYRIAVTAGAAVVVF